jgi:ribosomal protein S13
MKYMQTIGADYVMILGSDDIISTEYFRKTLTEMEKDIDLICTNVIYFYCGQGQDRGKLVKLDSLPIKGIGKTVSKKVLDQCDWTLWNEDKSWGMDAIASKTIAKYAQTKSVIEDVIVDVKTRVNLNSYRIWGRRLPQIDPQIFYNILGEEEKQILFSL